MYSLNPWIHAWDEIITIMLNYCHIMIMTYLSVCLSVCLSIHPYKNLSVCLSVHPSVHSSINPYKIISIYLSIYLSVCLSVCLSFSVYPSVHPYKNISICLFICLSVYLFICLYVCVCARMWFTAILWNSPSNGSGIMISSNAVRCVCGRERERWDSGQKRKKIQQNHKKVEI